MKASVIIPNYNGENFIRPCLDSLKNQTETSFEIIIVDNCSEDRSLGIIEGYKDYFGERLKLIRLDKNYGFSRAVNEGIKISSAPYSILLNNDTEADKCFVEEMVKGIRKSKNIFSCAAKMVQYSHHDRIDSAGDFYTVIGCTYTKGYGKNPELYNSKEDIFSACAGAAIYRKKIFDQIGYFDEMHFAYLEDVDIGYRAKIYGYRNVFLPKAKVYHVGSGSSGSRHNEFKVRLAARNNVYLNYKNMPALQLIINYPFIFAGKLVKYIFMCSKGLGSAYLRGIAEGYKGIKHCKKVEFRWGHLKNYLAIEAELCINLLKKLGD